MTVAVKPQLVPSSTNLYLSVSWFLVFILTFFNMECTITLVPQLRFLGLHFIKVLFFFFSFLDKVSCSPGLSGNCLAKTDRELMIISSFLSLDRTTLL